MKLTGETIGGTDLDAFVNVIPGIYKNHDGKRNLMDIWLHTNHHAAAIGEEVRKAKPGGTLLDEIAHFSMWLFTLLGRLQGGFGSGDVKLDSARERIIKIGLNYSDLLWQKYPRMCPVCYWRRSSGDRDREDDDGFRLECDCLLVDVETRGQLQKRKHHLALRAFAKKRADAGEKPASVDEWQAMFGEIFSANLRHLSMSDIAFHLLEELGEVSDAMVRMYTFKKGEVAEGELGWKQRWLEEELADVSSWLFALVEKVNTIPEVANEYDRWWYRGKEVLVRPRITLSRILWIAYGSDEVGLYCPICDQQATCECVLQFYPQDLNQEQLVSLYSDELTS